MKTDWSTFSPRLAVPNPNLTFDAGEQEPSKLSERLLDQIRLFKKVGRPVAREDPSPSCSLFGSMSGCVSQLTSTSSGFLARHTQCIRRFCIEAMDCNDIRRPSGLRPPE